MNSSATTGIGEDVAPVGSEAATDKPLATARFVSVGVLSDTHGHLYAEVKRALEGVDHIIHAGDVGSAQVLAELRSIAPVTAVRGNCDHEAWSQVLSLDAEVELGGARILVGHILSQLRGRVDAAGPTVSGGGFAAVISGHTHLALVEMRGGTLYVNPGSAGPLRFARPRTIARLAIRSARVGGCDTRLQVEAEVVAV
jgi:putative phosphoesterase